MIKTPVNPLKPQSGQNGGKSRLCNLSYVNYHPLPAVLCKLLTHGGLMSISAVLLHKHRESRCTITQTPMSARK